MNEKLVITLDENATRNYLEKSIKNTTAEVNADCLPSGVSLRIDICPPFGHCVYFYENGKWEKLGEAEVEFKTIFD